MGRSIRHHSANELPSADVGAFGFNGRLTYHFNDELANRLHLDFEFLSGDDPDTETTSCSTLCGAAGRNGAS